MEGKRYIASTIHYGCLTKGVRLEVLHMSKWRRSTVLLPLCCTTTIRVSTIPTAIVNLWPNCIQRWATSESTLLLASESKLSRMSLGVGTSEFWIMSFRRYDSWFMPAGANTRKLLSIISSSFFDSEAVILSRDSSRTRSLNSWCPWLFDLFAEPEAPITELSFQWQ